MSETVAKTPGMTADQRAALLARLRKAAGGMSALIQTEPVAIVGIGCRLPGGATDPSSFWELLSTSQDAIREVPADRWSLDDWFDPDPGTPGKMSTRWGGFIDQVDQFDAAFFQIPPREAACMDPQQRLILQVAWEALEDAGIPVETLAGSSTGVFMAVCASEYSAMQLRDPVGLDAYSVTGTAASIVSNRISYLWDLRGPSVTVDTACSSSLTAIHLACQSLRTEESSVALAGGVSLMLMPETFLPFSRFGMMARDGRCKTFDAGADGYVRGEGSGVLVLKRLSDAREGSDHIYAVIRGSAVNQDGRSNGLTAPNGAAQVDVIRRALEGARVRAEDVGYVEAHGTGTSLGDPIEVHSLAETYGRRPDDRPLYLGSAKTNVGHLEAAAGAVGVIKCALSLSHRTIPPTRNYRSLNPNISMPASFRVVDKGGVWPEGARLAAVSSFGFGGTNAHVVMEEAPTLDVSPLPARPIHLLQVTARSANALKANASAWANWLDANPDQLGEACATAATRRSAHPHRAAVVGTDVAQVVERLRAFASGEATSGVATGTAARGARKVAFLFPGQGSQWFGMARRLLDSEPVFRQEIEAWDQGLREFVDWSLLRELQLPEDQARCLTQIDVVQPVLVAIEAATAKLWRSYGVQPNAVVGHSMGEVAAAYDAGALSLRDAAAVICARSRLMRRTSGQGAMGVVELTADATEARLAGLEDKLSVAVVTSPRSTVISGDPAALDALFVDLEQEGIFCRRIKVDVASHSPQMEPLTGELRQALRGLAPRAGTVPMVSTPRCEVMRGDELGPDYWVDNLRRPVRFWAVISRLSEEGYGVFVEMSPHPVLLPTLDSGLRELGREALGLASARSREDDLQVFTESLGAWFATGGTLDTPAMYGPPRPPVDLPRYRWDTQRYWIDAPAVQTTRHAEASVLLGGRVELSTQPGTSIWQREVSVEAVPWLDDHRVQGNVVFPATGFLELGLAVGAELGTPGVRELTLEKLLVVPDEVEVQVTVTGDRVAVHARRQGEGWTRHATARLGGAGLTPGEPLASIRARCPRKVDPGSQIQQLAKAGLEYGERFRNLGAIQTGEGEALGTLALHEDVRRGLATYQLHPALLDSCFQLAAAAAGPKPGETWLPVGVDAVALGDVRRVALCHASVRREGVADLVLYSDDGVVVGAVTGLRTERVTKADPVAELLYEVAWCEIAPPEPGARVYAHWLVVDGPSARAVADALGAAGASVEVVATADLPGALERRAWEGVVHAAGLEELPPTSTDAVLDLLAVLKAGPARLVVLTRGAHRTNPAAGALWGLGRTAMNERPDLAIRLVDLDALDVPEIVAADGEDQVMRRDGRRYAARLARWTPAPPADVPADDAPFAIVDGVAVALEQPGDLTVELASADGPVRVGRTEDGARVVFLDDALTSHASASKLARIPDGVPSTRVAALPASAVTALQALLDLGAEGAVARLLEEVDASAPVVPVAEAAPGTLLDLTDRTGLTRRGDPNRPVIRSDRTYLLTGGLGGLGRVVAAWLVDGGARHLALVGRSAPSPEAERDLDAMRARGATVEVLSANLADEDSVRGMLATVEQRLPPLAGVVHAAGVLADATIANLTPEHVAKVMGPKVTGGWLLHDATSSLPLDFFVSFSSAAATLGSPGQGNYAAANAFLDALAHGRSRHLSVNWGTWSQVGLAAGEAEATLARGGLAPISPEEGVAALGRLLAGGATQATVVRLTDDLKRDPAFHERPLFRELAEAADADARSFGQLIDVLRAAPARRRLAILETQVREVVAGALRMPPNRIEVDAPLRDLGLDSLMGLQIRNGLEASLGIKLSATVVWSYPTVAQLAPHLAELLQLSLVDDDAPAEAEPEGPSQEEEIASLAQDDVSKLLEAELADLDEWMA